MIKKGANYKLIDVRLLRTKTQANRVWNKPRGGA